MIQWKEKFYEDFLKSPSRDTFKNFINNNLGELDNLDFKESWISKDKLSKTILAISNSGGGIIVFGVKENADGSLSPVGLKSFKDKADVGKEVAAFVPSNLDYEILDFNYDSPLYLGFDNTKYQMLIVHYTPERLPFVSLGESTNIQKDVIYVRRGTNNAKANADDIDKIILKKIETIFKSSSDVSLGEHLQQLKLLYGELPEKIKVLVRKSNASSLSTALELLTKTLGRYTIFGKDEYEEIDNPNYPEESYEAFILRMISLKKIKIEKVLDLK